MNGHKLKQEELKMGDFPKIRKIIPKYVPIGSDNAVLAKTILEKMEIDNIKIPFGANSGRRKIRTRDGLIKRISYILSSISEIKRERRSGLYKNSSGNVWVYYKEI